MNVTALVKVYNIQNPPGGITCECRPHVLVCLGNVGGCTFSNGGSGIHSPSSLGYLIVLSVTLMGDGTSGYFYRATLGMRAGDDIATWISDSFDCTVGIDNEFTLQESTLACDVPDTVVVEMIPRGECPSCFPCGLSQPPAWSVDLQIASNSYQVVVCGTCRRTLLYGQGDPRHTSPVGINPRTLLLCPDDDYPFKLTDPVTVGTLTYTHFDLVLDQMELPQPYPHLTVYLVAYSFVSGSLSPPPGGWGISTCEELAASIHPETVLTTAAFLIAGHYVYTGNMDDFVCDGPNDLTYIENEVCYPRTGFFDELPEFGETATITPTEECEQPPAPGPETCCDFGDTIEVSVNGSGGCAGQSSENITLTRDGTSNCWTFDGTLACGDDLVMTLCCDDEALLGTDDCSVLTLTATSPCTSPEELDCSITSCDCSTTPPTFQYTCTGGDSSDCECCIPCCDGNLSPNPSLTITRMTGPPAMMIIPLFWNGTDWTAEDVDTTGFLGCVSTMDVLVTCSGPGSSPTFSINLDVDVAGVHHVCGPGVTSSSCDPFRIEAISLAGDPCLPCDGNSLEHTFVVE